MKITRNTLLKSLFGGAIALPVFGKDALKNDDFKAEFSQAWKRSEEYTLTIFNQMPEDKFEFKYTPESFSYRTQFVHCIGFTAAQLCGRLNLKNPYDEKDKQKDYWKNLSKADLEKELKDFYAWVAKTVLETKPEKLAQMEGYAGGNIPIWRLFYAMENHIIHHRGQAICYLRLNGITPEGFIGW